MSKSCLKQDKIIFTHRQTVNIHIVFEINLWNRGYDDYPALKYTLFGAVKLVKNADTVLINASILDMLLDFIDVKLFQ